MKEFRSFFIFKLIHYFQKGDNVYKVKGVVKTGVQDFTKRMNNHPEAFRKATGETLVSGTINVEIDKPILIKEHFRIRGIDIDEPLQDLLFEPCYINDIPAYRIKPSNICAGEGGHGNDVLEITSAQWIPNAEDGDIVEITFLRTDLQ
jgi:hypothetical protein